MDTFLAAASGLANPIKATSLSQFLAQLLDLVSMIMLPLIVLFLVYIGFQFVSSQGKPEKLKEARGYLIWALVGALLILGAQALSIAIQATVNQL